MGLRQYGVPYSLSLRTTVKRVKLLCILVPLLVDIAGVGDRFTGVYAKYPHPLRSLATSIRVPLVVCRRNLF